MKKGLKIHWKWWSALLAQFLEMLVASFILILLSIYSGSGAFYTISLWLIILLGTYTAYRAVIRGLNNFLAWIAPPAMLTLGHFLAAFYLPGAGMMLLAALFAVIGAATGFETQRRRDAQDEQL